MLAVGVNAAVLRVAGWIQAEHVSAMNELIDGAKGVTALDLAEVTLVDRDVVPFLAACELRGIELRHCPRFLREWVTKERTTMKDQ